MKIAPAGRRTTDKGTEACKKRRRDRRTRIGAAGSRGVVLAIATTASLIACRVKEAGEAPSARVRWRSSKRAKGQQTRQKGGGRGQRASVRARVRRAWLRAARFAAYEQPYPAKRARVQTTGPAKGNVPTGVKKEAGRPGLRMPACIAPAEHTSRSRRCPGWEGEGRAARRSADQAAAAAAEAA